MKKKLLLATVLMTSLCFNACTLENAETNTSTVVDINNTSTTEAETTTGIEPDATTETKTSTEFEDNTESTSSPETTETETTDNLASYATVGQMVCGDTWNIALLYAKEYESIDDEYYSDKPEEGNVFLVLFFDIKNVSDKSDYFNTFYFEGYVDDYSVSSTFTINDPDGYSSVSGNIDPGKMSKGAIIYEVPSDWNKFEIIYDDGIWTSHKTASFQIEKSDISPTDYVFSGTVHEQYIFDQSKITVSGTTLANDTWNITLIDTKKYDTILGSFFDTKPNEGNEFVVFFLEATNISDSDDYFNQLYFHAYTDGYLQSTTMILSDIDGYDSMSGDVVAGKKIKGYIALEVPKEWRSIELIYNDGIFFENNKAIQFAIVNK